MIRIFSKLFPQRELFVNFRVEADQLAHDGTQTEFAVQYETVREDYHAVIRLLDQNLVAASGHLLSQSAYEDERDHFKLHPHEAEVMFLKTEPTYRGKGLAKIVMSNIAREAMQQGISSLYARVWYTNRSSIRAFQKSGWQVDSLSLILGVKPTGGAHIKIPRRLWTAFEYMSKRIKQGDQADLSQPSHLTVDSRKPPKL
ncbi:MAG: GNAT family N-acetyltransferase [Pseudomonadota bacterium]